MLVLLSGPSLVRYAAKVHVCLGLLVLWECLWC